jgi:hypothetical protein
MAKTRTDLGSSVEAAELLRDLLITLLRTAGAKGTAIREIVRCDKKRVDRIIKHIPGERKNAE